jgi:hypothetical protein
MPGAPSRLCHEEEMRGRSAQRKRVGRGLAQLLATRGNFTFDSMSLTPAGRSRHSHKSINMYNLLQAVAEQIWNLECSQLV